MRCSAKRLSLPVTLLAAGLLAAGCGGTISSSIGSLPSRTATAAARPSVTAAPATQPPATGSAAPAASSGTSLIWLWVLLGVLVLAGLIAVIARSSRRRSAAAQGWRSRLVDAYAKGSALHDAMSVAEAPGGLAAAGAAARWSDIQRRADDLAQTLYALREEVPQHSLDGARIADTLASLQAVRSAMDAERAPGGASLGRSYGQFGRRFRFDLVFYWIGRVAFWLLQGQRDRGADELEGLPLGAGRLGEHRDGDLVPVYRTWLRVSVARCSSRPRKLR